MICPPIHEIIPKNRRNLTSSLEKKEDVSFFFVIKYLPRKVEKFMDPVRKMKESFFCLSTQFVAFYLKFFVSSPLLSLPQEHVPRAGPNCTPFSAALGENFALM